VWRTIFWALLAVSAYAYVSPWTCSAGSCSTGLNYMLYYSYPYALGLIVGLLTATTLYRPFELALLSGILMTWGVGNTMGGLGVLSLALDNRVGAVLAMLWSLLYTAIAPLVGLRLQRLKG